MELFYTASQDAQAVSTAVDLFHFTVADDKPMWLWALELAQTTDLGDTQEEVLRIGFYTGVTGGGGGTGLTEVAMNDYNTITAGTAVVGQGTASTGGTLRKTFYWNIRQAGPVWIATPETVLRVGQGSSAAALRLLGAPADSITLSGEVMWAEG
jgi:hypothetical protein